ncbi:MAG: hypothetical protein EOM25_04415, partial [Deltaproteobacteria bacterium]|nr:hypothetical protein [Deltaproteobacteria bacterium]
TLDRVASLARLRHIDDRLARRLESIWEFVQMRRLQAGLKNSNLECGPSWIRPYQLPKMEMRELKSGIQAVQEFVNLVVAGAAY